MKKLIFFALSGVGAIAGLLFMMQPKPQERTTTSPEALEELRQGLDSQMKLYHREAYEHFRAALDLDPNFVAARVFIAELSSRDEMPEVLEGLRSADLETVSPRERLLASYFLANVEQEREEAQKLLADFLEEHPEDPYALRLRCRDLPSPQEAEDCYRQLIALEPNFVRVQNLLGYLAMGQGKFEEAEERFRTYQYLAPDQANPHDSMGELLLILGRYDEAKEELERALRLRPDFAASYENLVRVANLQQNFAEARSVVQQVEDLNLGGGLADRLRCMIDAEEAFLAENWEGVWQVTEVCRRHHLSRGTPLRFRADLWTGRLEDAQSIEASRTKSATGATPKSEYGGNVPIGMQYHLKGIRLGAEGKLQEAAKSLEEADRWFPYASYDQGALKIQNYLTLVTVLESLGEPDKAESFREKVRRVNPDFLRFEKLLAPPRLESQAELQETG